MSVKIIYKEGQRFGLLELVEEVEPYVSPSGQSKRKFKFICDCGEETSQIMNHVKRGKVVSCGCYHDTQNITHGATGTETHRIWLGIKQRCYNVKAQAYQHYGARGIVMSEEWRDSFEAFLADMGERPNDKMSIDRIDVNGNYCKENCRWTTQTEQMYNQRKRKSVSGYTGVVLKAGKYYVYIKKDKHTHYLGCYSELWEAVHIRIKAEQELYGRVKTVWVG